MARRKKNRDINVFSASAIDLFASSMGVFIILVVVLFPYFGKKSKIELSKADTKSVKELDSLKAKFKEQEKIIKEKNQTISEMKIEIEKIEPLKNNQDTKDQKIEKQKKEITELIEKIKESKSQIQGNTSLKTTLQEKNAQIKQLEIERKKYKDEIASLKEKVQSSNESQKRTLSSIKENDNFKKTIENLKSTISEMKLEEKNQSKKESQVSAQISKLSRELQSQKKISSQLEKKLKKSEGQVDGKSFLAVVMKWSTSKHDVDLVLKAPDGKVFDFKNKKYNNSYGEFVLDSRNGPGAEVWQSQQLTPGRYTLTSKLYNNYGNEQPAEVSASLFTKKGKMDIPPFKLSAEKKTNSIVFTVDKEGKIQFSK